MMNKRLISLIFISTISGLAATLAVPVSANPTINIVASNWKFTPSMIQLHVGHTITLRLASSEGVHGLESADLGIPQTMIAPGFIKTVQFLPKKPGKYVLHCTIMCGAGHANMTLTVNVVQ